MYFNYFPKIVYDIKGDGEVKLVTNILKRLMLRTEFIREQSVFDIYDVRDGDTPESIADEFYDDPELHWLVCYANNIVDRYHDWPMRFSQFQDYVADRYTDPDAVHHYEITQQSGDTKITINIGSDNTDHSGATAITNYEHEVELQDQKSRIRIIHPAYVEAIVSEFEKRMKEGNV